MAWVGLVIAAVGAVVGAASAVQQGQNAKAAANYQVKIGEQNAQISKQEAEDAALQHDRETFQRLGMVKAAQGKSGGTMEGSALDVLGDAASQSELEKQYILYRGKLGERQAVNTANLDAFSGEAASSALKMRAGSELLSGSGNSYINYQRLNRT